MPTKPTKRSKAERFTPASSDLRTIDREIRTPLGQVLISHNSKYSCVILDNYI